jgi:hypothetical protein
LFVPKGDNGVTFAVFDDGDVIVGVVIVDEEFPVTDGFTSNIALSRKRVRALDDDKRKAISNFVVNIIVRG